MFENIQVDDYTYATRFIASWLKVGGHLSNGSDVCVFKGWLQSLGISKYDIDHIAFLATNGKLELQTSANTYLKKLKHEQN